MAFLIDDRYEVTNQRLGGGAFGEIWLGRDRQTEADVAVKIAAAPSARVTEEDIDEAFNAVARQHGDKLLDRQG